MSVTFDNQNTKIFGLTIFEQQLQVVEVGGPNNGIRKKSTLANMKDFIASQHKSSEIKFIIIFMFGMYPSTFHENYIQQTARESLCSARVWTVTMTDKLKRVLSGSKKACNMDFLIQRFNSPVTVNPVQYYVTGDEIQPYKDELHALCYDLSLEFQSEYGVCAYARSLIE